MADKQKEYYDYLVGTGAPQEEINTKMKEAYGKLGQKSAPPATSLGAPPSVMGQAASALMDTMTLPSRALWSGAQVGANLLTGQPPMDKTKEIWQGKRTLGTPYENIPYAGPIIKAGIDIAFDPMMYTGIPELKALKGMPMVAKAMEDFNPFGAAAKAVTAPIKGAYNAITGPFKAGAKPEFMEAAGRMGMKEYPAMAATTSRAAKMIEGTSSVLTPLDAISEKLAVAKAKLGAHFNDMVDVLGGNRSFTDIGKTTKEGINEIQKEVGNMDNAHYAHFKTLFRKSANADANIGEAEKFLSHEADKLGGTSGEFPSEVKKLQTWVKNTKPGAEVGSPHTLDEVWKEKKYLNTLIYDDTKKPFLKDSERRIIETFNSKLRKGFATQLGVMAPNMREALDAADQMHSKAYGLLSTDLFKNIAERVDNLQFDKMVKELVSARSSEANIDIINGLAGQFKEGGAMVKDGIRASVLKQMISGMEKEIDTNLLAKRIKSFGGSLDKIFGPQTAQKLRDTEYVAQELSKIKTMAPIRKGTEQGAELVGALAGMHYAPVSTLAALVTMFGSNRFLASEVGQRWLTSGWANPALEAGAKSAQKALAIVGKGIYKATQEGESK